MWSTATACTTTPSAVRAEEANSTIYKNEEEAKSKIYKEEIKRIPKESI
jgi:hypothetical protein